MLATADVERTSLLVAPSSSVPLVNLPSRGAVSSRRSFGDNVASVAPIDPSPSSILHHSESRHSVVKETMSVPPALSRSASGSNVGRFTGVRPKLRGGGGNLAGVRLYRHRTAGPGAAPSDDAPAASTSAAGHSHSHARTQSVFSTRSATKDKGSLRYRRIQNKIYNILERPKDCRAITYHVLSFAVVFACLVLSIVQSADDSINLLNEISMSVELLMLLWFTSEYVLRIWSAGCRSKYQSFVGRLRFARRPLCIIDAIVIVASVAVVVMNASTRISTDLMNGVVDPDPTAGGGNMVPALRGLRFFQIMRMMRLDRRGSSWRLLSSVVWAHRQELFTAIYTGFLVLIFASFAMYLAERETNEKQFKSYADALWWGVITLCTVGYGDKVPQTAIGRVIGSCCAMIGISFFALPPGILGSGLALKVQQQQRQKHQIRRRVPAAMLIQSLWRMVGTEQGTVLYSTWHFYITHQRRTKQLLGSGVPSQPSWAPASVTDRLQMAAGRLVSVSRRSFRDRESSSNQSPPPGITMRQYHFPPNRTPEGSPIRARASSQDQSNPSMGPTGPLSTAQCNVIRAVRRMKFLVCRRKLRESMRPYDVKDVIEQYSSGHAEILSRLRQLQYRMDDMMLTMASRHPRSAVPHPRESSSPPNPGAGGESPSIRPGAPLNDEDQLEWRMNMLDRKLDVILECFASSGVLPKLPPTIVVSSAAPTRASSADLLQNPPVPAHKSVVAVVSDVHEMPSPVTETTATSARNKETSTSAEEPSSSTPTHSHFTSAADTRPTSSAASITDERFVVAGIVVDNESSV